MHELSIAAAVLEIAERHAAGRPLRAVDVRVGHLRQVVPSSLAFAFEVLTEGTVELRLETVPAAGRCTACRRESVLEAFPLRCAACGGLDLELLSGEELQVTALELEEPGVPEAASAGQAAAFADRASGGPPCELTTTGGAVHGDH